jgi:hypothetical protein
MLTASEYYNTAATTPITGARATDNINATGAGAWNNIATDTTVNSLRLTGWDTRIPFTNGATLTVASGALLFADSGRIYIGVSGSNNGYLSSGDNPLTVTSGNIAGVAINVPIINNLTDDTRPGLIVAINAGNGASLTLGSYNNYRGYTHIQTGLVYVQANAALNPTGALLLDSAGTVVVGPASGGLGVKATASALRGNGTVNFANGTTTGNRPTNSGIIPNLTRSWGNICRRKAPISFSLLPSTLAPKPMALVPIRLPMILSIPSKAPPQINSTLVVSICKNS